MTAPTSAFAVLRRGFSGSPQLLRGLPVTVGLGLTVAVAQMAVPVIIQLAIDRGGLSSGTVESGTVVVLVALGFAVVGVSGVLTVVAQRRLIVRAEETLRDLRVRAFDAAHRLSMADHNEEHTGSLTARVTSDVDALSRFVDWGLFAWVVQPIVLTGVFALMAFYSWPMAVISLLLFLPILPLLRAMQRGMLRAHSSLRVAVGDTLNEFGEALGGAEVIRAYGAEPRSRRRMLHASQLRYRAGLRTARYGATVYVIGDFFSAVVLSTMLAVGVFWRDSLGLTAGSFVAVLFLTTLIATPTAELSETLNTVQEAVAGWRRVLDLIDHPVDLHEPQNGVALDTGPLGIDADAVTFAYRSGKAVLHDVTVRIDPGAQVAVVGETGSGKTTFAKLLMRLADPVAGSIELGGIPLDQVERSSRLESVRLVPQDGFLFNTTIDENIRLGREGTTDDDVTAALDLLGLEPWLATLPDGLQTVVGDRGSDLSVGERQLVAFARAAVADPGLLILDEATSSVDPETDRRLTSSLARLADGRTLVSIAHRLATAESADVVLVFDQGRLVQQGSHAELVDQHGPYSELHKAWTANAH